MSLSLDIFLVTTSYNILTVHVLYSLVAVKDGLDPRNVEFWSGGLNLFTPRHACNMQRLVSLDPAKFSSHLIYHSANNKQRQLHWKRKSFTKVNDLFGELLTVTKDAEEKMKQQTISRVR